MGNIPGEKRVPGRLVHFQGLSPPGSGMIHTNLQEIKQMGQEACMNKELLKKTDAKRKSAKGRRYKETQSESV